MGWIGRSLDPATVPALAAILGGFQGAFASTLSAWIAQRHHDIQALTACQGRTGGADGAAARLDIPRTTLIYRMRKLGIYAKLYS